MKHQPLSDGDLLQRYVLRRDQEAFAELVRRLGPSVWSVCNRILREPSDAEDAFQATFLVLARKAGRIQPAGKVAGWIYGVANLTARKARLSRSRRLARVRSCADLPERPVIPQTPDSDLGPSLHEELNRLPEKYRLPIVLCELRELTTAQAAGELGWPVGTVASRLSRGRSLLTDRLVRRGISPVVAITALGTLAPSACAAVPTALSAATLSITALGFNSGAVAIQTLSLEVMRAMSMTKLSLIGTGLAATAAFTMYCGIVSESRMVAAPAPVAKTGKADAIDRFKLEGLNAMLSPPEIQKALGLSDGQVKALDEARTKTKDKIDEEMKKLFQPGNAVPAPVPVPGPGGGIVVTSSAATMDHSAIAALQAEFDTTAIGLLKPEQVRRLRQIAVQIQGPQAMLDRRVIRALELTAEQEDQIDAELAGIRKPGLEAAKFAVESEKALAAVLKHLTADQTAKWEQLIGKPIPMADLVKANPRFDGPFGGVTITSGQIGGVAPIAPPPPKP